MTKRPVCVPDDERGFLTAHVSAIGCRISRGTAESFVVVYTSIPVEAITDHAHREQVSHDTPRFAVKGVMHRLRFSVDVRLFPLPFTVSHLFLHDPRSSHLSSIQCSHVRTTGSVVWSSS